MIPEVGGAARRDNLPAERPGDNCLTAECDASSRESQSSTAPHQSIDTEPPLRVLVAHNTYQQRGGEDGVVEAEDALLRHHGHVVERYTRNNDDVRSASRLSLARDTVWSPRTYREVAAACRRFRPDVVHVHNSFPLVSPSICWAVHKAGVPVVLTLHNFRLLCPQAMMLRDGKVCSDCVGHVPWRSVVHACYRGNRWQSAAVASMLQAHRAIGTWREKISVFIALNEFCKDEFVRGGLPAEKIRIKPNFSDIPAPEPRGRSGLLFVGRLSQEKGLGTLLQAWQRLAEATALTIIGTGPEAPGLALQRGVRALGHQDRAVVLHEMTRATALVVPSIWPEMFGLVVIEAFACGLPVIASRIGALATLVEHGHTGLHFQPGDTEDLCAKLEWASRHGEEMRAMGVSARRRYEQRYTGEQNVRHLTAIYRSAIGLGRDSAQPDECHA